jgi:hypothetical protein
MNPLLVKENKSPVLNMPRPHDSQQAAWHNQPYTTAGMWRGGVLDIVFHDAAVLTLFLVCHTHIHLSNLAVMDGQILKYVEHGGHLP